MEGKKSFVLGVFLAVLCFPQSGRSVNPLPDIIGTNALITRYDNDNYQALVNFNPGHGETVDLNPPRFRWFYTPTGTNGDYDVSIYKFQFQVSYETNFASPVVNVSTPYNFYNLVDHFTSNTVYWRVGYSIVETNITVYNGILTLTATNSGTNWTGVRQFSIATNAVVWDRAIFASTNFLATNGLHPHIGFRNGEQTAVSNYLAANKSTWFTAEKSTVLAYTNEWWWKGRLSDLNTNDWLWLGGNYLFWGTCRMYSVSNVPLSGYSTNGFDIGLQNGDPDWRNFLTSGDRVLVNAQTDATQNGIYVVNNGAWVREPTLNSTNTLTNRVVVQVRQGWPPVSYWVNTGTIGKSMSWSKTYTAAAAYDLLTPYSYQLARAAFIWQMTGNPALTNGGYLQSNLVWFVQRVQQNGWCQGNAGVDGLASINIPSCYAYDWLYDVLTPTQRSNILAVFDEHTDFHRTNQCLYRVYDDGTKRAPIPSIGTMGKKQESHTWVAQLRSSIFALATYGDSSIGREWLWANLNYWFGQGMQMGDEQGMDRGKAYGTFEWNSYITEAFIPYYQTFKAQGMTNFPGVKGAVEWWSYFLPLGYRHMGDDTWGDGGTGYPPKGPTSDAGASDNFQIWPNSRFLVRMSGDGAAQRLYDRATNFFPYRTENDSYANVTFWYNHSNAPVAIDRTNTAKVYPKGGWAFGASTNFTDYGVFTNGVGFMMQARPTGGDGNHTYASDLDLELWAYGTPITEGGGAYDSKWRSQGLSRNTWLINNEQKTTSWWPVKPVMSYLTAFQQGSNYVYAAGEAANAYLMTDNVTRARRHLLFMRNKYFILFDELATKTNSTFAWTWHIRPQTLTNVTANSFSYSWTNLYTGGPTVTTIVAHVAFANLLGVKQLDRGVPSGYKDYERYGRFYTNIVASHPFTGEHYFSSLDQFRAHAIYYTNSVATTNWHFMTVIYPVKAGDSVPTITRITDNTVRVQNGGDNDVVSFGEVNVSPASTLIVNTVLADKGPPSIVAPPQSKSVPIGSSVTISVVAGGASPLSYQWRRGGVALSGATGPTFTIASAAAGDAGDYTVVVGNSLGSASSSVATLTLRPPSVSGLKVK